MATLLFSAIGTLFGGPFGGAVGALVGRSVDRALIGGGPNREGPRLKELSVSTSSYGTSIPRVHGRMRVPGTIIWATDLIEHRDKQGGGKGRPSVVTYSYTASLAVALSSRPLSAIGRIWADGNLLRGAAGDLKTGGSMRFYSGADDQDADPLLIAAEGAGSCPAYRGLAYVVFEDLQLGDFGNRIPALTFEVFSNETTLSLADLVGGLVEDVDAQVPLGGVAGLSCESSLTDLLGLLDTAFPIDCDVSGSHLSLGATASGTVLSLAEPAISVADDAFGAASGFNRTRKPPAISRPEILRYYDVDRDYQPGQQRAPGRPTPGQPDTVELPVAMAAADARQLSETISRRAGWARQTLSWRSAELDPQVRPGSLVTVSGEAGIWRVNDWEWREGGIELSLLRSFAPAVPASLGESDSGRLAGPVDAISGATEIHAFELPWDGSGQGDIPALYAAVSSAAAGWSGAALFVDQGDGQLVQIGTSGRAKAVLGTAAEALPPASPHVFDRKSSVRIELVDHSQILADATTAQLATGANRALLGNEIIQFSRAVALGSGRWRLEGLLRGRAATEADISGHVSGERFVLLDDAIVRLDPAQIGENALAQIVAIGLADEVPPRASIANRGVTRRPLFPVHSKVMSNSDGSLNLVWTRRSRGSWSWLDGVEVPLHEQAEAYEVLLGDTARWLVDGPGLAIDAMTANALRVTNSGEVLSVCQRGTYAQSIAARIAAFN